MADERGVNAGKGVRGREEKIGRPLRLIRRPVVLLGPGLEDLAMQGVQRTRDRIERPLPVGGELLVHQPLSQAGVAEMSEAVVMAREVGVPGAGQLPGEPLTSVQTDLDVEREPGLDAGVHESEAGMEPVLVDMQALTRPTLQAALVAVWRAMVLETHTRLDGGQRPDEPVIDRMFGEPPAGQGLLVRGTGGEVPNRPGVRDRRPQGGVLHALARCEHVVLEVEQRDVSSLQEVVHPLGNDERQQRTPKDESVKTAQHRCDHRPITRDESVHGIDLGKQDGLPGLSYSMIEAVFKLGCGRASRSPAL